MEDLKAAILPEDIKSQFRVFGESLQVLNEKVDRLDQKMNITWIKKRKILKSK